MRHFVVLGFETNSKAEAGEVLYADSDRAEALGVVNAVSENHARRELYELAVPQIRRHRPETKTAPAKKKAAPKAKKKAPAKKKAAAKKKNTPAKKKVPAEKNPPVVEKVPAEEKAPAETEG
jgi:hypothetical protein